MFRRFLNQSSGFQINQSVSKSTQAYVSCLNSLISCSHNRLFTNGSVQEPNHATTYKFDETYDYIVLGAGSAGSVITNRLSEIPENKICLIEAGSWDRNQYDSWKIQMPSALTYNVSEDKCNWNFYTIPQKNLNNRTIHQPRGKVVGGSSAINAMVYARGHACDFNRWQESENCENWSYQHILPYFKKAQKHSKGSNEYRGDRGYLDVTTYDETEMTNILFKTFIEAGVQAGYPYSSDLNGYMQEGFGSFDMTISPNGERCSASNAYIHNTQLLKTNTNLKLKVNTLVTRILFDGKDAIGVEIIDKSKNSNNITRIRCNNEIIVSLGSIGSPQLLLLSKLGNPAHLRSVGVLDSNEKPILDNIEIGSNLQDHLEVYLQYYCKQPVTLYPYGSWSLRYFHQRALVGIEWFLRGTGICASNQFESGAFIRSGVNIEHPDIQYHFIPGAVVGQADFLPEHAFQVHVGTLRAKSKGAVSLSSNSPFDAPLIDPNYFDPQFEDLDDMRRAARLADEIVQQNAFATFRNGMLRPDPTGDNIKDIHSTNSEEQSRFDEWIRNSSHSAYHPSCTCAMGTVVDSEGRLMGVNNVRVCDASIMPSITSGNLNAPTIAMAEKISDCIKGVKPLEPENAEVYVLKDWQTKQR